MKLPYLIKGLHKIKMLVNWTFIFSGFTLIFHSSRDKGKKQKKTPTIEVYYSAQALLFQVQSREEGKRKRPTEYDTSFCPYFYFLRKEAVDSLSLGNNDVLDIMLTTSQISSNLVLATTLQNHRYHCYSHFIDATTHGKQNMFSATPKKAQK